MTDPMIWNVIMIDDDPKILVNNKKLLDNETIPGTSDKIKIKTCSDFDLSLDEFDKDRIDLVIVDLKKGPAKVGEDPEIEEGEKTLQRIRARKFLPVVFYTAWPHKVKHLEGPHVKIVRKPSDKDVILAAIKTALDSPLPVVTRALITHLEKIEADFMWGVADEICRTYGDSVNPYEIVYLLARRISLSLSDEGIKTFLKESGAPKELYEAGSRIHPMQYYVIPPLSSNFQAGDLFFGKIDTKVDSFWCLLTPSCDIEPHRKGKADPPIFKINAEYAVFAKCLLLTDQPEFRQWQDELKTTGIPENKYYRDLMGVLTNNRSTSGQPDRYIFLPGVLSIPDLIIDFQQLKVAKLEVIKQDKSLKWLASIDPPYSDSILSKFSRYFGRVGTPDLNCSCIISKLSAGRMKDMIK